MTATVTAVNQTQSLAAIRNFVRAAVSFITYARGLCNDNAYAQRPFLGLPLRQLIPSTTESVTISEWIERGAFDALNRNYLKEMSLCVYDEECRELLESYCFGFNYSADGQRAQMSLTASQNAEVHAPDSQTSGGGERSARGKRNGGELMTPITTDSAPITARAVPAYRRRRCSKQEVQRMLSHILERLLDVVGCLPPLLSKRVLTMRLTYYDEITPRDYEPPCFAPASRRMLDLYQEEVKLHVHIGSMDTSHHFFSVAIRHPLLHQVQSQRADQRTSATGSVGEGEGASAGQSAPLRSHLDSTFSSEPMMQESAPRGVDCDGEQQKVTVSERRRSFVSRKASDARHGSLSSEDGGAAAGGRETCAGDVARDNRCCHIDSVRQLVEEAAAVPPKRVLKHRELIYLLLASFVFAHAPSVHGGRGRISRGDVEAYRVQSCPLDVSEDVAERMLRQLSSEGYLVACHQGTTQENVQKLPRRTHTAVFPSSSEWTVPDPPLSLLQRLLQLATLTPLLTHPCHVALQELCVYLEREKVRAADCTPLEPESPMKRQKRGRE
ncbi:hypothetical protein ABB37_05031 [Leptomonas pyrrhocoris]|uniref:HORMA domain-containing protein n=1 Tax=Leptomonas pyrrhocoris TaxID=157538 RepID=A0A0M9G114_LEPPY|nr:hypothetical protein ABB37_05031 [Leptomonas pyrrhocoris]KPA79999.1 hypothetical protein ABB37_05031 [Leptomonas pyrrhocoris]|eukprot:XP_015658438.1 hypothetical protein ABB37_05031 [Leptomonas pyrrhocoris]